MPLKIVTYFETIEFGLLNHSDRYNIIKNTASHEDCFACAMSNGADMMMEVTHPVSRLQDLFSTFENYDTLPTILLFYVISEDTMVYAISTQGRYRNELRQLFLNFFECKYKSIIEYSFYCGLPEDLSGGVVVPRTMVLEKSEFLEDILRGVTRQEFVYYRKQMDLTLQDGGYYLYLWLLRSTQGTDYCHHISFKNLYDLVGDLLKHECEVAVREFSSGEVFYTNPRTLCILINAPPGGAVQPPPTALAEQLTRITASVDARCYMSGYIRSIEKVQDAFLRLSQLKPYHFFCRDTLLLTDQYLQSVKKTPTIAEVDALLRPIQKLVTYDLGNPQAQELIQKLFLTVVKPSLDYRLFFYCFQNVSAVIYLKLTDRFQTDPPFLLDSQHDVQHTSLELECSNLIGALSHLQASVTGYISQAKHPLVAKAVKYIQKHYAENITLITLSRHLNISSVYLSQLFKRELGTSPIKYIISCRIDKSKELLLESNDTIYNIAIKVGFLDSKHFSKTFKRVTGVTPMQYKKNR